MDPAEPIASGPDALRPDTSAPHASRTNALPDARALDEAMDAFLRRWTVLSPATIPAFAERTAAWLGLDPYPRMAAHVFPRLGIRIERQGLPPGIWAVWSVEDGAYRVRVSPFLSAPRANFTLWHEWFEIMAARPAFPRLAPALLTDSSDPIERHGRLAEALSDRFAACLTMPAGAVFQLIQELAASGDKTDVMAARLGVSVSAMRRRIRELGLSRPALYRGEPVVPPHRRTDGSCPDGS